MRITGHSALQDLFDACGTAELIAPNGRHSAMALHHGANDWSRALRRAGITRGDRVICALPNGAAFAQLLVAALADGVTLAPVAPGTDVVPLLDALDARIAVADGVEHPHVSAPSRSGGPPSTPLLPRAPGARTDGMAFLLRTSGTTTQGTWIALTESGVMAVLESHLPLLAMEGASALCVLPWSHAFGLVLGLLPALLRARRIVTVADGARDMDEMLRASREHAVSHLSMVPLTASLLASRTDGHALLHALAGGLVGGATIDARLAESLTGSRLRVGYGQTEASPGIMVGDAGVFHAGCLGRPVGCEVRIDADGVMAFRGPNACGGLWTQGALRPLDTGRWQRTGDVVTMDGGLYTFVGRDSDAFKLSNGRLVQAAHFEAALRAAFPNVTDVVLTSVTGTTIDVLYSTQDALPLDDGAVRQALGGLARYVGVQRCVGVDAWRRTAKGEIDRRRLPAL